MANVQESRDYLKKVLGWEQFCKSHKNLATHLENVLNETETNPVEIATPYNCEDLEFESTLKMWNIGDNAKLLIETFFDCNGEIVYVISLEKEINPIQFNTKTYLITKDLDKATAYFNMLIEFGRNLIYKYF